MAARQPTLTNLMPFRRFRFEWKTGKVRKTTNGQEIPEMAHAWIVGARDVITDPQTGRVTQSNSLTLTAAQFKQAQADQGLQDLIKAGCLRLSA